MFIIFLASIAIVVETIFHSNLCSIFRVLVVTPWNLHAAWCKYRVFVKSLWQENSHQWEGMYKKFTNELIQNFDNLPTAKLPRQHQREIFDFQKVKNQVSAFPRSSLHVSDISVVASRYEHVILPMCRSSTRWHLSVTCCQFARTCVPFGTKSFYDRRGILSPIARQPCRCVTPELGLHFASITASL